MTLAFKFTKPNGLTRRVVFPERPNWPELAARISVLYTISLEHVGVSYFDSDGDEVTLSSQEELEDFYVSSPPTDVVKLTVLDLTLSREDEKSIPPSPGSRGTFGGGPTPLIYDIDEDWQIPFGAPFAGVDDFDRSASLHAYVETVESSSNASRLRDSTASSLRADKGKGREVPRPLSTISDKASTASVVEAQTPTKPPIHVHAVEPPPRLTEKASKDFGDAALPGVFSPPVFSTPRGASTRSGRSSAAETAHDGRAPVEIPDPPSPTILPEDVPSPSASLSNDIASLLNSMSFAFSNHPELTGNVRRLMSNFQSGTYWASHRETVARAAEDIRRASMDMQSALGASVQAGLAEAQVAVEEESGRRVTEAISNVLRIFGDVSVTAEQPTANVEAPQPAPAPAAHAAPQFNMPPPPPTLSAGLARGIPIPPPPSNPARSTTLPPSFGGAFPNGIPPPPPLPNTPWNAFRPYGAAPSDPAVAAAPAPNVASSITSPRSPEVSFYTSSPVSPEVARGEGTRTRARANDSKAALEAAKEAYKQEKARYRAERDARRRRHEQGNGSGELNDEHANAQAPVPPREVHIATTPPDPTRQVIAAARGGFPQLVMIRTPGPKSPKALKSPRRLRTASGSSTLPRPRPSPPRPEAAPQPINQAMKNIVDKLDGMGFNESTHPSLSSRIDARLPVDQEISHDKEMDVVSSVVDDLLSEASAVSEARAGPSSLIRPPLWM